MTTERKPDAKARTHLRSVRISDDVWEPAREHAKANDTTVSALIREALIERLGLEGTTGVLGRADRQSPSTNSGETDPDA